MLRILRSGIPHTSVVLAAVLLCATSAFADSQYGGTDPPCPTPPPATQQQLVSAPDIDSDDGATLLVTLGRIAARLALI